MKNEKELTALVNCNAKHPSAKIYCQRFGPGPCADNRHLGIAGTVRGRRRYVEFYAEPEPAAERPIDARVRIYFAAGLVISALALLYAFWPILERFAIAVIAAVFD